MKDLPSVFGINVFNDDVMRQTLSKTTYQALKKTIADSAVLDINIANSVANAMKNWAMEKGVTHFTHWFQPMTGITAEKHDCFLNPAGEGKIIMEFSGKELIQGEPDASSFPNGGIRATFEARGYTAWDPTSYAFIKNGVLCIPTAFCSYGGEVLDKKTPLLRSMDIVNKHALRILRLFGNTDVTRVKTTVGAEQEYFLIDRELFKKRKDLIFTNRTLFGARPPKGQELEDHYFGALKERVLSYMTELDEELWKMGVYAKTRHNEAAPSQHELAPVFTQSNVASDQNQLIMETMKSLAIKHNLACILHEKPFSGINGSGKHNNWSLSTNTGVNLLDPGSSPYENAQFLLFLTAIIRAVDAYQDLLRVSVASAGNDHRLGASEAPPAIVSIFLGDELFEVVESLVSGCSYNKKCKIEMEIGVDVLPHFPKDNTDRNRTSPFAFTGNKFEFRMVGSTFSVSGPNIIINTIVAEALDEYATILEKADNFNAALQKLIPCELKKHKRIIFNGNSYSREWAEEAEKRGLLNLKTTVDALPHFIEEKNVKLFSKYKIFSEKEVFSRYEILVENYVKTINIEALTMIDMINKEILPASEKYLSDILQTAISKKAVSSKLSTQFEESVSHKISGLMLSLYNKTVLLDEKLRSSKKSGSALDTARFFWDEIAALCNELRSYADELELIIGSKYWPFPTYSELLFSV